MKLRKLLIWSHKWSGIALGAIFALLAITGVATVFRPEMAAVAEPDLHRLIRPGAAASDLESMVEKAEGALDASFAATTVYFPLGERYPDHLLSPVSVAFERLGPSGPTTVDLPDSLEIVVDPVSAEVLGLRTPGLLDLLVDIHTGAVAGWIGEVVVGLSALFLVLTLVSGLVVWWPRPGGWRKAFQIRTGSRMKLLYGLHTVVGSVAAAALLLSAVSGLYLSFPEQTRSTIRPLVHLNSPFPTAVQSGPASGEAAIGPDEAMRIGREAVPDGRPSYLQLPDGPGGVYRIKFWRPGQPRLDGETNLWLDQYSGAVVARRSPEDFSPAEMLLSYLRPIHVGEVLGLAGRLLVFAAGMALLLSVATGVWFWLGKPKSKPRRAPPAGSGRG